MISTTNNSLLNAVGPPATQTSTNRGPQIVRSSSSQAMLAQGFVSPVNSDLAGVPGTEGLIIDLLLKQPAISGQAIVDDDNANRSRIAAEKD